jgi:hypothetical protein
VRSRIIAAYGRSDFTDVRPNTGFVILGWLAGHDFSERITICNNCGEDTDSSTASLGALLGILDPEGIPERWLTPIGRSLVLNDEIIDLAPPATLDAFTDLVERLRERLDGARPRAAAAPFDPAPYAIPVELAWTNTTYGKWNVRDQTELPPEGSAPPAQGVEFATTTLPGTWVRMPRADFADRILLVKYQLDVQGRDAIRIMLNSTEHFRVWLDGEFLWGAQGTQYMFPAPHMAPVGQFHDLSVAPGPHELLVAIKRPPAQRDIAEWVLAVVERPSYLWIENALRPVPVVATV